MKGKLTKLSPEASQIILEMVAAARDEAERKQILDSQVSEFSSVAESDPPCSTDNTQPAHPRLG